MLTKGIVILWSTDKNKHVLKMEILKIEMDNYFMSEELTEHF